MPAPAKITAADVRHVAKLARLAPADSQLPRLAQQLGSIIQYVAKVSEANTESIEPMAHAIPLSNVLRDDIAGPALPVEKVLQNAPATDGPFFAVPKIIGNDEDSAG